MSLITHETMTSDNAGLARSPSVSSTSTVGSNSSTGKLIKRLSVHKNLNGQAEAVPTYAVNDEGTSSAGADPSKTANSDANVLPKPANKRKPIKFTVRKVSHEPVNAPPSDLASQNELNTKQHHKQHSRQSSDASKHNPQRALAASQAKYDQYTNRIDKINKEIDFLNNLLPPYNVEIDYTTRTKIVRAIEKLRTKQDELSKKKYSLGITISRLWREQDAGTMWVRSVSN